MILRFTEDEVLPNCDESPSAIFPCFPQTREAAFVPWKARVLPSELHRAVCGRVCVCESASALSG